MNDLERLICDWKCEEAQEEKVYPKPTLKVLSEEQVEDIHARGLITPAEKLAEYNDMNYCPFTNGCSRCSVFENCNDCLIDYVNTNDEWISFLSFVQSLYETENECSFEEEDKNKPKMLIRE